MVWQINSDSISWRQRELVCTYKNSVTPQMFVQFNLLSKRTPLVIHILSE